MTDIPEGLVVGDDGKARCWWATGDALYRPYHDDEWGHPVDDDRRLFEKLCLEGFQSGLSWLTILRKRDTFRRPSMASTLGRSPATTTPMSTGCWLTPASSATAGKIAATITNARRYLDLVDETGSLAAYLWTFEPDPSARPERVDRDALMAMDTTPESTALSKDLRRRGWAFVGPTTVYAAMQAMGIVNDHLEGCFVRPMVEEERARFERPDALTSRTATVGRHHWDVHPRHLLDRYVPRGAILLTVLTFGSYVMGLVRDRILVRTFGAGEELDAFNAAFVIPELSLGIVVASGVAAPFVPMFMGLRRENEPDAQTFGQTILTLAVLAMGVVSVLLFIFAPLTVPIVASGFGPAQQELYIQLFRVMTLTPIIFAASLVLGEVLVADRRFLYYGLAPILYNAGLAFGALVLSPEFGIFGAAIGAVIGACLHLAIRVVGIRGTAFRIRARLALQVAGLRDFFRLALPKTASVPIEPLTFLFFTNVASTLVAGSITSVSLARNFQSVPVSLFGVAFSLAAFPGARHGVRGRRPADRSGGSFG